MFLRQRKPSHISRCSCSQWKLAHTRNVTSRGKKKIDLWSGKFSKELLQSKGTPTASPANYSYWPLRILFSASLSPLFSHARYISTTGLSKLPTRICQQLQSLWVFHQCSHNSGAVQRGFKVCQPKEILCHCSYARLRTQQVWQQLSPGSTAVSTPGTLLAELHWAGAISVFFQTQANIIV